MIHNVHKSVLMNESGRCPGTAVGRAAQGAMDSSRQVLLPPRGEKVTAGRMRGATVPPHSVSRDRHQPVPECTRLHPPIVPSPRPSPAAKRGLLTECCFAGEGARTRLCRLLAAESQSAAVRRSGLWRIRSRHSEIPLLFPPCPPPTPVVLALGAEAILRGTRLAKTRLDTSPP